MRSPANLPPHPTPSQQSHRPEEWRPAIKTGKKVKDEFGERSDEYATDKEEVRARPWQREQALVLRGCLGDRLGTQ